MATLIYSRHHKTERWSFSCLAKDEVGDEVARGVLSRARADHPETEVCVVQSFNGIPFPQTLPKDATVTTVTL